MAVGAWQEMSDETIGVPRKKLVELKETVDRVLKVLRGEKVE